MLIIPLWPNLRVGRIPIVTLLIAYVCVIVHLGNSPALMNAWAYYPDSPNPLTMISSALIHADWLHLIGNMIFYLAFALALELVIGNPWRYLGVILALMIGTALAFSLYSFFADEWLPTVGYSGVVMGIIGLSAYLMPRARIRTFAWFFPTITIVFHIPAWVLAVWYVGWDTFYLVTEGHASGINLLAHVSGGVLGYLLGLWWFRDRKWLIEDELDDEIDYMRARRSDFFASSHISKCAFRKDAAAEDARGQRRDFLDLLQRVERLNNVGRQEEALTEILEGLRAHGQSEEILAEVFEAVLTWRFTLFTANFARHYVNYLLDHGREKVALNVCESCFRFAPEFLLARPLDVIPLARMAERQQRYELAYSLVYNAEDRYGDAVDLTTAQLMEARLLAVHLGRRKEAKAIVQSLLARSEPHRTREVSELAGSLGLAPFGGT